MTLIVDASVGVKLGVLEEGADRAKALVKRLEPLVAPELFVAEVCNALWGKEVRGQLALGQRASALASCVGSINELVACADLAERALELAVVLNHPVYDCFYLALTEARGGTFITADARLLARLGQGGWAGRVEAL